jgi:hypothetical protein
MKMQRYVAYSAEEEKFEFFDSIDAAKTWLSFDADQGVSCATIDGHSFIAEIKLVTGCMGKADGSYEVFFVSTETVGIGK